MDSTDQDDSVATELTGVLSAAIEDARQRNRDTVAEAAGHVFDATAADGLVFTAGAGHSLAAVAETFYRAGGLAPVYPIYHPELLPLHGASSSTAAERKPGLAAEVLAIARPGPSDALVVFSNSGVNPYPVELAAGARAGGAPVIAVTSSTSVAAAPRRADSTLIEEATVVLDTGVRPGDASYPSEEPRTAALSSILNTFLWNMVLATVARLADARGVTVPLWRSSNVPGGDAANAELLSLLQPRIPALR